MVVAKSLTLKYTYALERCPPKRLLVPQPSHVLLKEQQPKGCTLLETFELRLRRHFYERTMGSDEVSEL